MIPKIIHYCWFGRSEKPELAKKCIASWRRFCPDFEICEWNEGNCDYYKKIGIDIPLFWKNILHMCPVMFVMGAAGWLVLDHIRIDNWFVFFALAAVYTVIYWVLAYLFMMNDYEKSFVKAPVSKIVRKLQKR